MTHSSCAYCGSPASTEDHVIPRALYPASKRTASVRWIKVAACLGCNQSWTDDEAHARNILVIAGEPNASVHELWQGPVLRSFGKCDGPRRLSDLTSKMIPVQTPAGPRDAVYPGRDERVLKVIRKMIRGLCHHHSLLSPVSDQQVWADILRFEIPPAFVEGRCDADADPEILRYTYVLQQDRDIHSLWFLSFYERTPFLGFVYRSDKARLRVETEYDRSIVE